MTTALLALLLSATAVSPRAAIATAHPLASEAGAEVLRAGGNAVDAAVAAALALAVVQGESSGLGGGGFALVWLARERRMVALDFRETAPAAATPGMFLVGGAPDPERSLHGGLAVAVPGAVKGYAELARRFGRLPFARLAEPAARIAETGFAVGPAHAEAAAALRDCLAADPAAAREFLVPGPGGRLRARRPGERLVRAELAATLRLIGRDPEAFYRGPLAARIAAADRARGGILAASDLAAYRTRERAPLWGSYRGYRIASMPPPSAGGAIVLALLQALEADDLSGGYRPVPFLHAFVEVEKRLFAARAGLLADPDAVPGADAAARRLVDPGFDRRLRAEVGPRATPSSAIAAPAPGRDGGNQTTHVSVVDAEGNAVALTTTVNARFGSCVVVPGTGILLDDEMDDFDAAPGAPNGFGLVGTGLNGVAPGKRPLSSMAPTIVLDAGGRAVLAVGSPGGSTIPSTVAQVILHVLGDRMPLGQAVGAPRIHHQWLPDEVLVEPFGLDAASAAALEALGHRLAASPRPFGNPQAAAIDWESGLREAASEPRGEGIPAAP